MSRRILVALVPSLVALTVLAIRLATLPGPPSPPPPNVPCAFEPSVMVVVDAVVAQGWNSHVIELWWDSTVLERLPRDPKLYVTDPVINGDWQSDEFCIYPLPRHDALIIGDAAESALVDLRDGRLDPLSWPERLAQRAAQLPWHAAVTLVLLVGSVLAATWRRFRRMGPWLVWLWACSFGWATWVFTRVL